VPNRPAPPAIYTLSYTTLFRSDHRDAGTRDPVREHLRLGRRRRRVLRSDQDTRRCGDRTELAAEVPVAQRLAAGGVALRRRGDRSEEHTSELQSRSDLVCRLLL